MLSRRALFRTSHPFRATAPATTSPAKFEVVKFVQEDMAEVSKEVPNFSFYAMPEDRSRESKYQVQSAALPEKLIDVKLTTLEKPTLKFAQLENGLKIASIDNGGDASHLGLFVNAGSRFETPEKSGVSHMIEMMAYRSTAHLSHLRTGKTLEALGVEAKADANREYISYSASCLREYMPLVAPIMIGNVLYPRLLRWEVAAAERKVGQYLEQLHLDKDELISELLHEAAFHNNTLGRPLYASEASKRYMDEFTIRDYIIQNFSPQNMSFVGVNVNHADLCKWVMRSFADYNTVPHRERPDNKPVYTGGYRYQEGSDAGQSCHFAIAFHQEGGWNAKNGFAVNVLNTILGGTGNIGSGMQYSRLNVECNSRLGPGVVDCASFNRSYSDAGLFGVYGGLSDGARVQDFLNTIHVALATPITADELTRGKNQLKRSVSAGNSFGEDQVTDIGNQLAMSGEALSVDQLLAKIDAVTEPDVKAVQAGMFGGKKPTVAAYGTIGYVPHYDKICSQFASTKTIGK